MSALSPQEIESELAHAGDNRGPTLIAAYAVCLSLAYIAVLLRFISRRASKNALLADDWMVVVGLLLTSGQVAVGIDGVHIGAGRHIIFLADPVIYVKGIILIEVFYTVAAATIKFSTLLLYHRIFNSNGKFMIACWVVGGIVSCYSIAQIVMSIFQCTPVHKAWDPETPGTCLNTFVAATTPAAINVVADFATVFLPMPLIWRLQMQWKRKIQILGIFMLGGFVIIASIYRAVTMKDLSHVDASWANVDPCLWSIAENGVAIVSTCLPTLRPLYSLVARGHYCNSKEYCTRCQYKSSRLHEAKSWRSFASSSTDRRQGSDRVTLPGSVLLNKKEADVENQSPMKEQEWQHFQGFSIVDQSM